MAINNPVELPNEDRHELSVSVEGSCTRICTDWLREDRWFWRDKDVCFLLVIENSGADLRYVKIPKNLEKELSYKENFTLVQINLETEVWFHEQNE